MTVARVWIIWVKWICRRDSKVWTVSICHFISSPRGMRGFQELESWIRQYEGCRLVQQDLHAQFREDQVPGLTEQFELGFHFAYLAARDITIVR